MPFYYFPMNSYYMFGYLLVIIGSLIMIYGQIKVNSAYKRYERIPIAEYNRSDGCTRNFRSKWIE